eukprot:4393003-Ditylum_brightwellii.AAC.1
MLESFDQDIKVFNAWFTNKQIAIVKEVGTEGYTKYLRCLFKPYKTAKNKELLATITKERCKWMFGHLPKGCGYADLMELALKTYNNQKALGEWNAGTKQGKPTNDEKNEGDMKFIALLSKLEQTLKANGTDDGGKKPGIAQGDEGQQKGGWKYCYPQ